jgi:hypothetical protein
MPRYLFKVDYSVEVLRGVMKEGAAVAMAVGASGVGSIETVRLLTPEEVDAARAIDTGYRPPGA